MAERRVAYRDFMGKPEGKKPLGNLSASERILLKCALKQ